jgi:RHS repeat-associated protein
MTMKKANARTTSAVALALWLLGPLCGYGFYSPEGRNAQLLIADSARSKATPQSEQSVLGELVGAAGAIVKAGPPFRLSPCQDDETDLLYYGYRYYNASTGRWLSRDPLGDGAFVGAHCAESSEFELRNVEHHRLMPPYHFVHNNPICEVDVLGLDCCCEDWLVDENANILLFRYQSAHRYLDPHAPKRPFDSTGSWSCFNLAKNILQYMAPTPPCWTCHVENRLSYRLGGYFGWWDENSIVCTSHPVTGAQRTVVFDYYQDWTAVTYSTFSTQYPTPWYTGDDARSDDCGRTDRHHAMDTRWLDNIINPAHGAD